MDDKQVADLVDKMIDDFLEKDDKEKNDNVFYPSELPYCKRKNYYSRRCNIPFDAETKRLFHMGNLIHNFITFLLKKNFEGKLIDSERSLTVIADAEHDIDIRGRLDNLVMINDESGSEKTIFEVKSTANISFMKEAQEHHVMQITPYLRALQMKKGYIVYVEKNTLKTKVFPVEYNKEIFLKLVNRAKDIAKHLRENTLPEADGKKSKWECNYCSYKTQCDNNYNPNDTNEKKSNA
jgi:CRISPR-associated exonuclease Cas4